VSGTGVLDRDQIEVIGGDQKTSEVSFSINPVEAASARWHCDIGFLPFDWEIGHPDEFYVESYAPNDVFRELETAYLSGRLTGLSVRLKRTLWVRRVELHKPPSSRVTWCLIPEIDHQSDMPQSETGRIESLRWQEVSAAKERSPQTAADKSGVAAAEETMRADAKPSAVVAKPSRSYSVVLYVIGTVLVLGYVLLRQH
jgi:hypothetical protein